MITGRSDDMMKIKGVNVFPKQIEEILGTFPELSSEYQIRISHLDGKDSMRIYVEASGSNDFKALQQQVAAFPSQKREEVQESHRRALPVIKNSGQNEDRCFRSRAGARLRIRGQNENCKSGKDRHRRLSFLLY